MLRKFGEHDGLHSLVFDKDMTRRCDDGFQGSEGGHEGAIGQDLVTEASTGATRIPVHLAFGAAVLDQFVVALYDLEIIGRPHTELHGGTRLFAAHLTVTPTGQGRIARHLRFESSAHASIFASRRRRRRHGTINSRLFCEVLEMSSVGMNGSFVVVFLRCSFFFRKGKK